MLMMKYEESDSDHLMELTIEQVLQRGVAAHKEGKLQEAERFYRAILKSQPSHPDANHNLGILALSVNKTEEALPLFKTALDANPYKEQFWLSYIDALIKKNQLKDAEVASRKALDLKQDFIKVSLYLSGILLKLGRLEDAEASLRETISLKPEYAEAHSNLGITLQELGRLEEAEASFRQTISLKPEYAEAHNNLGNTLKELGRLEEAVSSYTKAIELNPHFSGSHKNLAQLLTSYAPHEEISHPIIKVNQEIKKIYLNEKTSESISDDKIMQIFSKCSSIIKKHDLKLRTNLTQAYRRNSIDLNCKRHKTIFNKFNIIPKFCFGCYKVQVEPRSILELIKLFIVFDQIKLVENNTRKCLIEIRPEISGFYKGLIYCSSLEEAYQISDYLGIVIKENIGLGLNAVVKRGCSEYPISFPDYKVINKSGAQLMNYNEKWKLIEQDHDSTNPIKSNKIITPSLSGLNLHDILIIRNWIDYAKGIGDPSVHLLNQNTLFSPTMYKIAKTRLNKFPWQDKANL
jgi:tetratricopeptide (TPR) repeat protein